MQPGRYSLSYNVSFIIYMYLFIHTYRSVLYTLVNQTKRTLVMVDSELTSGKWFMEQHPPSYILPYSKGVIVTASKGPFSGTEGFCHYRVEPTTTTATTTTNNSNNNTTPHFVKLLWINPKV